MKKRIKLRDITFEQYSNWYRGYGNLKNACGDRDCCSESCIFHKVDCHDFSPTCWVNHKDVYNDSFLNQEIEMEDLYNYEKKN